MSIKSNYFKMNNDEFKSYLNELKSSSNTIHLLNDNFFYNQNLDSINRVILINEKIIELDLIINSFSNFTKNQIIQSFLIDEIESTNKIENIYSTKHDIFKIINNASKSDDKKIVSISNAYKQLVELKGIKIESLKDIRNLYGIILKDAIQVNDLPDGVYFRKNSVYVSDGFKTVHTGVEGEDNINYFMDEFIKLYNSKNEILIKMILCHFIFEYVHPFYDGNGRMGRFLISNGIYLEKNSFASFLISSFLENEKDRYYKAFSEANNKYSFGFLNEYVDIILDILVKEIDITLNKLKENRNYICNYILPFKMTKSEEKIYKFILEATYFSNFGVSNEEIMNETQVSKRTLISTLNKFKMKDIIIDTKIGKISYHKIML